VLARSLANESSPLLIHQEAGQRELVVSLHYLLAVLDPLSSFVSLGEFVAAMRLCLGQPNICVDVTLRMNAFSSIHVPEGQLF
jgi:hypothetical protein